MLALAGDPVEQPGAALQRVRPPGGLLPPYQDVVGGLEEQHLRPHALSRPARSSAPRRSSKKRRDRTSTTTAIWAASSSLVADQS